MSTVSDLEWQDHSCVETNTARYLCTGLGCYLSSITGTVHTPFLGKCCVHSSHHSAWNYRDVIFKMSLKIPTSSQNKKMKKIWSEPVFLKNMNDYLIFWSYFIMLRFFSRMGYWDEIYKNTLSCIECLRSPVGICPLLYLTLPYCINSETAPPLFVDRPQTCPSGSVTTWEGQPWRCTRSTCPRPSMAWHSLKLPSKSLSLSLPLSFFSLSLSISKQR